MQAIAIRKVLLKQLDNQDRMPIIDNELIGNDTAVEDDSDTVFELLEKIIRDNIKQDGDALWMVSQNDSNNV